MCIHIRTCLHTLEYIYISHHNGTAKSSVKEDSKVLVYYIIYIHINIYMYTHTYIYTYAYIEKKILQQRDCQKLCQKG